MAHNVEKEIDGVIRTVTELDHTAQEIDDAVEITKLHSNPNLLDNWYFAGPINQRGQTEYSGNNVYAIDRWKVTGVLLVEDGGITVKNTSDVPVIRNFVDNPNQYRGKVLTFSVQVKSALSNLVLHIRYNNFIDVAIRGFSNIPAGGAITVTGTVPDIDLTALFVQCSSEIVTEFSLRAAKLELGDHQTLARQDENGNWVLNEIPDYGEQLARCQRYFFKVGDASRYCSLGNGVARDAQYVSITIPTPVTMRTVPGLIAIPAGFTMRHSDTLISGGANFVVDSSSQNSIMLKIQSQVALTPGDMWEVFLQPNGSIMFSADL